MTDPWAEVREYAESFNTKATIPIAQIDLTELLADADALLAVVRATIPYRDAHTMEGANQEGESILDFQERLIGLRAELDKALASLPEHLK